MNPIYPILYVENQIQNHQKELELKCLISTCGNLEASIFEIESRAAVIGDSLSSMRKSLESQLDKLKALKNV